MKKSDKEPLVPEESSSSKRLPKLESLLRSEVGQVIERELELPYGTLLTITTVHVLPDLSQVRIGVSVLPLDKSEKVFKVLVTSSYQIQKIINGRLRLYRVPRLSFYLDSSLAEADRIDHLLDSLKTEM